MQPTPTNAALMLNWRKMKLPFDTADGDCYLVSVGGCIDVVTVRVDADTDAELETLGCDEWCWCWEDIDYYIPIKEVEATLPEEN